MPSRDFSSPTGGEPVTFRLFWTDRDGEQHLIGSFDCLPELPAYFGQDMLLHGDRHAAEFFDVILTEESRVRFEEALRDREHPISQKQFDEVSAWLVEVYTGRPTGQPNAFSNGGALTGSR